MMQNMKYPTDMFIYHKESRRFSQEASTLNLPPFEYPNRITLQNPKTLGLCVFEFLKQTEENGDIQTWEYISIAGAKDIQLTIWND